jgi:transposase InsO family protein
MKEDYPIRMLCECVGVARSGYYEWAAGRHSARFDADRALEPELKKAFAQSRQSYGYRRLSVELRARGHRAGKQRVARLMRQHGLRARPRRGWRPRTTQSHHDGPIAPNRLREAPAPTACDQLWRTDITYVPTREGWLYLAVVIDAHSRRVLGWAFSASLETRLVIQSLLMAIARRGGHCAKGLVLHSDRGVQYTSLRFRRQLHAHGITASMSLAGNCYDNALAESFFSTFKTELVYRHDFADRERARLACFEWIEAFYNRIRRHSSIGFLSPVDFEHKNN